MTLCTQTRLEPMRQSEVAALHTRHQATVEKKAAGLLEMCGIESTSAAQKAALDIMTHALRLRAEEMLFAGRIKPALQAAATGDTNAAELLAGCLERLSEHVEQRELEKSRFGTAELTPKLCNKFNRAAVKRTTAREVAALFGQEQRLYFPLLRSDTVSETEASVAQLLAAQPEAYRITNWAAGHATDRAGKQSFKIGKLLAKLDDKLYKAFQECPTRLQGARLLVVLSRAPLDIANASINRAWFNCAGANGPDNFAFRKLDSGIKGGMLVAYLVSESDPDILNPLARSMIKPFDRHWLSDKRGTTQMAIDFMTKIFKGKPPAPRLYVADKAYGLNSDAFLDTVNHILREKLNVGAFGIYKLNTRYFYDDAISEAIAQADGSVDTFGWRYFNNNHNHIPAPATA